MNFAEKIVSTVENTNSITVLQETKIGTENINEFLIFFKPEIFLGDKENQIKRVGIMLEMIKKYDVDIDGMIAVAGPYIEEKGIMASHYGFINQLSNNASKLITEDDKKKMSELLGESIDTLPILGGHEVLKEFPDFNPITLDNFWFTKKSIKVKGGMYFQKFNHNERDFILVDGFHPAQLAYFTNIHHKVLLLIGHSKTDWKILRGDLIGSTFPEKADPSSIRGILYTKSNELGLGKVDIAANGIHLSAGPFEGMSEIANFVGKSLNKDLLMETTTAKALVKVGLNKDQIYTISQNPTITTVDGKMKDIYGLTEDMNFTEAITFYMNCEK